MTIFDEAVALRLHLRDPHALGNQLPDASAGEQSFEAETSSHYANFVGPFGGITAATLLNAVKSHDACVGEPLSMTVNYAAPIKNDRFLIAVEPVQTGGITQHWVASMKQGDRTV